MLSGGIGEGVLHNVVVRNQEWAVVSPMMTEKGKVARVQLSRAVMHCVSRPMGSLKIKGSTSWVMEFDKARWLECVVTRWRKNKL